MQANRSVTGNGEFFMVAVSLIVLGLLVVLFADATDPRPVRGTTACVVAQQAYMDRPLADMSREEWAELNVQLKRGLHGIATLRDRQCKAPWYSR